MKSYFHEIVKYHQLDIKIVFIHLMIGLQFQI